MRHYIYILSAALSVAVMAGCSKDEFFDVETGQQSVGSQNSKEVPEGYFVATFSTSGTRAETDFDAISGEDPRVFDLRYLIYDDDGNFVKEGLIFDDFDADNDDEQDWPLPPITDTLPLGYYKAVFVTNTDPDIFQREADNMPLPEDLLSDYKLGFDQARLNLPYLLGANDPDFFMDVIEFSHEDPSETVYLQRIVGVFKAYRSLVDINEGLNLLIGNLVENIKTKKLLEEEVPRLLSGAVGDAVGGALTGIYDVLPLNLLVDPIVNAILGSVLDALYDILLETLIDQIGGLLEGNNDDGSLLDILDPLLNPWKFAEGALVTVTNQPTQFGFDMEVKARDSISRTYYLPIVDTIVGGESKYVIMTKYLGFVDIDNDNAGEQLMTLNKINAAISGVVGGLLIDKALENKYLLNGALFDITDSLNFNAPNNLQAYNEYSLADLGLDDYDTQEGEGLDLKLNLGDIANLGESLDVLNIYYDLPGPVDIDIPLGKLVGDGILTQLLNLDIALPINLPLLNLSNLNVSGSWDPENTVE